MHIKKLFLILFVGILMISMISIVSADCGWQWDNIKTYNEETQTIEIKNMFGLGQTIAELKLLTPHNNLVPMGEDIKVAEISIELFMEDCTDVMGEMLFYDLRNQWEVIERNNSWKYKENQNVLVNDWENVLIGYSGNGTAIYEYQIVGTHNELQTFWYDLPNGELPLENGEIVLGLYSDVNQGDYVEWIPTLFNFEIPEWASWTASLKTGLAIWYDYEEASGNAVDGTGNYTGTANGNPTYEQEGKIDYAWEYDGVGDYIDTNLINSFQSWSFVSSFYSTNIDDAQSGHFPLMASDVTGNYGIMVNPTGDYLNLMYDNGFLSIPYTFENNTWYDVAVIWNHIDNEVQSYVNGISIANSSVTFTSGGTFADIMIGFNEANTHYFIGKIDNTGIWAGRPLTGAEVGILYNIGLSCSYDSCISPSPTITLNTPTNDTTTDVPTINFNATISGETPINVSLIIDGTYNETNSSGILGDYLFTKTLSEGSHTWLIESCGVTDCGNSSTYDLTIDTTPHIQFETPTPANNSNLSVSYIPVNVSLTETYFQNLTFYFYKGDVLNESITFTDSTRFYNKTLCTCDNWKINATTCTTTNQCNSTETRTIAIDLLPPVLSSANNLTDINTLSLPINSSWNFTATDNHLSTCWYSNVTGGTNHTVTCNSQINTTWATQGNKTIQFCANDTFGFETCKTEYIWVYLLSYTQADNPDPAVEGFSANFNFTINRTNIPTTTANLILNNTIYTPTSTAGTNGYFFEVNIIIPDTWGNTTGITQDWLWNYSITGISDANTTTDNITIYELAIDDCSSYGEVILEFNLYDEETATAVNESAGANVEVDLKLTSKDDASVYLDFNKTWVNENNPKICIPLNVLNNSQYWIDFTVGFDSTDRVWEFYYLDDGTLNLTKIFDIQTATPITLFDLLTTDSTSFLFNYFDQDGLAVDDAIVHVYRKYIGEGTFREVERAKSDLNGDTIVHLVEEDVLYYFIISQYGSILFTSSQYTALCQATPCTIQIEASGEGATFGTDWDIIDGGAYTITSSASARTVNLTYSLNDSSTMNLTVYNYNNDGSYSIISTTSDTGSTGSMILTVPQSAGNVSFFATVYQDEEFINSEWVDFEQKSSDYFGSTLALFLGALIILTLGLMAVSEGVGTLVFVILGVAVAGFLGLITTELSTGVNIVIYLVLAGGILLWKLTGGRK